MTFVLPPWLEPWVMSLSRYDVWQILCGIFVAGFLLNLAFHLVLYPFTSRPHRKKGDRRTHEGRKRQNERLVREQQERHLKKELQASGLAIEKTRRQDVPTSMALASDDEGIEQIGIASDEDIRTEKFVAPQSLEVMLDELERLEARIGRDKSGEVVMVFLNGKKFDSGLLEGLTFFPLLESLHLRRTQVGDEAVPKLMQLKNLRYLYVSETRLTPAGIGQLKKNCAELKIED